MFIDILRLIIAALSAPALGFIWYHPKVFGSSWMRLVNLKPDTLESSLKKRTLFATSAFLAAFLLAFVLDIVLAMISNFNSYFFRILWMDVLLWVGFMLPVLLNSVFWEKKPFRLFVINSSYWLFVLVLMSVILTVF